jgi:hypothetical protein
MMSKHKIHVSVVFVMIKILELNHQLLQLLIKYTTKFLIIKQSIQDWLLWDLIMKQLFMS